MMRASWLLLTTLFFSACTTAPVREEAPPMQPAALRAQPVCHPPEYLVRDLTVPWAARTYVVGPCPDKKANAANASPAVPASSEIDLSASQRTAP
ncbi:MAG: hypothetical protein ACRDSN_17280 [Pseudonocardiaceae bacterium]